jgi:glyoxylase-like metal-dependent hydrolase (beta-lactamase superfamily II)
MVCGWLDIPHAFLIEGGEGTLRVPIPSYLIEHPKGTALFDTGLQTLLQNKDQESLDKGMGALLAGMMTPVMDKGDDVRSRLQAADRDPDKINFIINSHLHFDHVGGNELIPNATLVVQKREWHAGCSPECQASNHYIASQYDLGHKRIEADGEYDLFGDGTVVCIPSYGHTPGHQSLKVKLADGEVVLTGDSCYLRRSLAEMKLPDPMVVSDAEAMLAIFRQLRGFQKAGAQLIFGHDPGQWQKTTNGPLREFTATSLATH